MKYLRCILSAVAVLVTGCIWGMALKTSGYKFRPVEGAQIHIECERDFSSCLEPFPLASLMLHSNQKATLMVEPDTLHPSVRLLTGTSYDCVSWDAAVNPCHIDASIQVLRGGAISVTLWGRGVTFDNAGLDPNVTYELMLPSGIVARTTVIEPQSAVVDRRSVLWIGIILVFDLILFIVLALRGQLGSKKQVASDAAATRAAVQKEIRSSILLFGDFKVIDSNGDDITKSLSPMLQELFLLLICHTPEGGISSASLKECLWFDKDATSARNNRAVYMNRLKKILERVGECSIVHNGDFWSFDAGSIYIDYYALYDFLSGKSDVQTVDKVVSILSSGKLLAHLEGSEWSDRIKSRTSDEAVTFLEHFLGTFSVKDNPELVISASDALFLLDSLNETALSAKCRAYRQMGNHAMVKKLYDSFKRDYSALYGENFGKDLSDIMLD